LDLDDIERNMAQFPGRTYKLQYEELITKPEETFRPLLDFLELDWTPHFESVIQGKTFYNPVNKWRKHLSEEEGKLILEFFERANERKEITANA
jgi:hypothetical protein